MNQNLPQLLATALLATMPVVSATSARAAEPVTTTIRVSTDFEGGSARVLGIDQTDRVIRFMPGGDPARGWPCWWYLRVDGLPKGEQVTLELAGSDLPARNNGQDTGKPLSSSWAMPAQATFSADGTTWQHTSIGERLGPAIRYVVSGDGGPVWVAWGPPFTPHDTDQLIEWAIRRCPAAQSFELTRTRGGLPVRGLHFNQDGETTRPAVWVQARQHAWESGSSWVARGLIEWVVSEDADAQWLRSHVEIFVVPIMDVDNVATGNGGKEAAPRDHNRDWDDQPVYPEVAATQKHLRELAKSERLALFLDLHNPAPNDLRPFFYVGPEELLSAPARAGRQRFLELAQTHIAGPLKLAETPKVTGPGYHPLWRQISGQWVNDHGSPHTVALCLETSWNTPHSTTAGYLTVGRQLGQAAAEFLRNDAED